jgi:hypothetical protein
VLAWVCNALPPRPIGRQYEGSWACRRLWMSSLLSFACADSAFF